MAKMMLPKGVITVHVIEVINNIVHFVPPKDIKSTNIVINIP